MVDLDPIFQELEDALLAKMAPVLAEMALLQAKMAPIEESLALVRQARAEARQLRSATIGSDGSEKPVGMGDDAGIHVPDQQAVGFMVPELHSETGEPIYDPRVVAGKRNFRLRAYAAARVYGPELQPMSLAYAIFATGETRAANAVNVRSALRGLIRYRAGSWALQDRWFHYLGQLTPNVEMIDLLSEEPAGEEPVQAG